MSSSSSEWNEDDLVTLLSGVLLVDTEEEIDGLDDDLVRYIAGLLSTQLQESDVSSPGGTTEEDVLEQSMVPFLESVGCPNERIDKARAVVLEQARVRRANGKNQPSDGGTMTARKLRQGIVNMSSTLTEQSREDAERYSMPGDVIKANANVQKDAYSDKTSAKEKRKQRQELEKVRRDLERANQQHSEASTKSGVSAMVLPTVKGKDMDVNVQDITLSLDNGTVLMDHGDLKFAYKRRYAIIGENGVVRSSFVVHILCLSK